MQFTNQTHATTLSRGPNTPGDRPETGNEKRDRNQYKITENKPNKNDDETLWILTTGTVPGMTAPGTIPAARAACI